MQVFQGYNWSFSHFFHYFRLFHRSIFIEYIEDSEIRGIPTYKFGLPKELFLSPLRNPDNECFCPNKQDPLCMYDGVMDASPCKKGAPIALSLPHFYGADRRLMKSVVGLKPDKNLHETYLNIEPVCYNIRLWFLDVH